MIITLDNYRRIDIGKPNDEGLFEFSESDAHVLHELIQYSTQAPPRYITTDKGKLALVTIEPDVRDDKVVACIEFHYLDGQ